MPRNTWVYPDKGEPYLKSEGPIGEGSGHPTILSDLPDFVSPIDRKLYSGRTGLREHCAKHDVVPTADLAGLPIRRFNEPYKIDKRRREERRQELAQIVNSHWR